MHFFIWTTQAKCSWKRSQWAQPQISQKDVPCLPWNLPDVILFACIMLEFPDQGNVKSMHWGMWTTWTAMGPANLRNKLQLAKSQSRLLLNAAVLFWKMAPTRLEHLLSCVFWWSVSHMYYIIVFSYDMPTKCLAGEFATVAEVYTARLFQMDEASHHNFFLTGAFAIGC